MRKVPSTLRMGAVLLGAILAYSAAFAAPVTDKDLRARQSAGRPEQWRMVRMAPSTRKYAATAIGVWKATSF
jgi:hypothetical protein